MNPTTRARTPHFQPYITPTNAPYNQFNSHQAPPIQQTPIYSMASYPGDISNVGQSALAHNSTQQASSTQPSSSNAFFQPYTVQQPLTHPSTSLRDHSFNQQKDNNYISAFRALGLALEDLQGNQMFFEAFKSLFIEFHGYMDFSSKATETFTQFFDSLIETISLRFNLSSDEKQKLEDELFLCFKYPKATSQNEEYETLMRKIESRQTLSNDQLGQVARSVFEYKINEFIHKTKHLEYFFNAEHKDIACYWIQKITAMYNQLIPMNAKIQQGVLTQIGADTNAQSLEMMKKVAGLFKLKVQNRRDGIRISDVLVNKLNEFGDLLNNKYCVFKCNTVFFQYLLLEAPNDHLFETPIYHSRKRRLPLPPLHPLPSSLPPSFSNSSIPYSMLPPPLIDCSEPVLKREKIEFDDFDHAIPERRENEIREIERHSRAIRSLKVYRVYDKDQILCIPIQGGDYNRAKLVAQNIGRMQPNEIRNLINMSELLEQEAARIRGSTVLDNHGPEINAIYDRLLNNNDLQGSLEEPTVYIYKLEDDGYYMKCFCGNIDAEKFVCLIEDNYYFYDVMVILT